MHLFKRTGKAIGRGFKAFTLTFSGRAGVFGTLRLPNTSVDYERLIGNGTRSSIIMAVCGWSARTFPESPVMVQKRGEDGYETVAAHEMCELIEAPNPFYSGVLLWMATRLDWLINGNAYWIKQRNAQGRVVQIWWIPQQFVEPKWPQSGNEFISHYEYKVDGSGKPDRIEVDDVVHFRYGLDPANPRKGLSPLGAIMREVYTDEEAAQFTAVLLKNLGIPGLIIAPKNTDDTELTDEDAEDLKAKAIERFGGDKRGEPMVTQAPVDVHVLGYNPQQLDLKALRRVPEERVTAIFGVPAIVVGLGAGLDRSTFANFEEARQAAYESHIIPDHRLFGAELKTQLLTDFEDDVKEFRVGFDTSDVRVLQDDVNALFERAGVAAQRGLITVNDFNRAVGLPQKADGDVYLRTVATIATPVSGSAEEAAAKSLQQREAKAARNPGSGLVPGAQRALTRFLAEQAERVAERLRESPSDDTMGDLISAIWPDSERDLLAAALRPYHEAAADQGWDDALARIGDGKALPQDNPAARALLTHLAARVTAINDTTRTLLATLIQQGFDAGIPVRDLAATISSSFAFSPSRAETIARTEMVNAANQAAVTAWEDSGVVSGVRILDGDECGWTEHNDPDLAHGSTRTLEDFANNSLAHPNCVRVALPIVE